MKGHKLIIILLLILSFGSTVAQKNRLEIPVSHKSEQPFVVTNGEEGFYFLLNRNKDGEGNRNIYLANYDSELNLLWEKEIPYIKNLPFKDLKVFDNKLYILFQNSRQNVFEIIRIEDDDLKRITLNHISGFTFTEFLVFRDKAYFIGQLGNMAHSFAADLSSRRIQPIAMAFRGKEITATHISLSRSSILISVIFKDRRENINVIREIDPFSGQTINDLILKPDGNFDLISAQGNVLDGNETVVIGTYALPNSEYSQGLYFSLLSGKNELFRRYHSFTDLSNFFSFLGSDTEEKIKAKAERKKSRGKDLKVKYQLLAHEIIKRGDEFLLLGEAFYPVFRTERVYNYYRGMRVYDYVQVFDGYQYTHATVAGFNSRGDLKWDQSFPIEETRLLRLEKRISICGDCDEIPIAYNGEGVINIAKVSENSLIKLNKPGSLSADTDKVRQASLGDSEYWYDNNFLFWGYQKIINKSSDAKNRRIFYINKVKF